MIGIMFANKDNTVETYQVNIDTKKIKHIKKLIDNYSGKGNKLETISSIDFYGNNSGVFGKRIEIISKKYVGQSRHFDYCCSEVDLEDIYKYEYYSYTPHRLSGLCDSLLKTTDSLNLSYCIGNILNYKCKKNEDQEFKNKIINAIKFKKINKISVLLKIKKELKNLNNQENDLLLNIDFNNVVNKKMESMQTFNEAFYSQELKGQPFKYNITDVKRKILTVLPTGEKLKTR